MKYHPRPSDIEWTRRLIEQMADGGMWGIPRANSVWRFDKTNKKLVLVLGDPDEPDNIALKTIAPLVGYTTEFKPEPLTPVQVTAAMAGAGKVNVTTKLPVTEI